LRVFAAHDRKHLQAIHLCIFKSEISSRKSFASSIAIARLPETRGKDFRPTGQLRNDLPVHIQQIRIIVQQQDLWVVSIIIT